MKRALSGLVLMVIMLAGCAPAPQRMSDADRKAVQLVSVNASIAKPPVPSYLGPGGAGGLAFGGLGAIATESARADARNSLREFVELNGVFIERIVFEEFSAALRSSGKLRVVDKPEPGAASINILIRQYGLSIPHGFSSALVPTLFIVCEMTDASGKPVWSASDRVLPLGNPVEGIAAEDIRNNAGAIERVWRAAAKHISANIVKAL